MRFRGLSFLILFCLAVSVADSQAPQKLPGQTQIVFLGTGTPAPNPDAMGFALAIIVRGTPYIVDAGTGVVRRAAAAANAGIRALRAPNLKIVFITHLHTDHTLGLPDLINTPWIMGRTEALQVYGPVGVRAMTDNLAAAYAEDHAIRINGLAQLSRGGDTVVAHEIEPGLAYRDSNVTVTAFRVRHGSWPEALGYRFQTPDRVIVISGDTSPTESVAANCNGCDVLIHEVCSEAGFARIPIARQKYFAAFHTSTRELARVAAQARPKLLILDHQMYLGGVSDAGMLSEIQTLYPGPVVSAHDLDLYENGTVRSVVHQP